MRLLSQDEVPAAGPEARVYRESRVGPVFLTALFLAVAIGTGALGLAPHASRFPLLFAAGSGLGFLFVWPVARASFRPTNWLLRSEADGVYIKFRSHLNDGLPREDKVVVHLEHGEIAEVILRSERRRLPDSSHGGTRTEKLTWIDLRLASVDTHELELALERERTRRPEGRHIVTTIYQHFPLLVEEPGILRMGWRSSSSRVVPSTAELSAEMEMHGVRVVTEPLSETKTFDPSAMDDAELDRFAVRLQASGESIQAIELLRRRHGIGLAEAKSRLEEELVPPARS
jgi:hypothetical protein